MSHFIYKARKSGGEVYKGEIEALDHFELYKVLHDSGDQLVKYKEKDSKKKSKVAISIGFTMKHVKMLDKINFARNLGSMLSAGLTLSRALSVIQRQTSSKYLKEVVGKIMLDIDAGLTFSEALAKFPRVFSSIFVSMVHAGEQSGNLSENLRVLSVQMDSSYSLEKRIRGSLMYPSVIVIAMIIIAILMFIFVIPTLMKTFSDLHVQLPFTTQIVLGISNLIKDQGLLVFAIFNLIAGTLYWWVKKPSGKRVFHRIVLKIPIIGGLVQEVNAARTARTLSSLLGSGVEVVESIMITATVVQNVYFKDVLNKAAEAIKKGDLMSKIFAQDTKFYPVFFAEMMSVGEETGKTDEMLLGVAKYYEEDVNQKTKDMSTIIEPFLILLIGAAVGFFAVSMITPMYSLMSTI